MGKARQGTLNSQSILGILRSISTDTMAFKPFSDTIIVTLTSQMRKLRHGRRHILPKISEVKGRTRTRVWVFWFLVFCDIFFFAHPNVFYLTLRQLESSEDFRVAGSELADDIIKPNTLVTFNALKVLKE